MIELVLIAVAVLGFPSGLALGAWSGVKLRGFLPLRSPSNKVRIENAEADVKIAESRVGVLAADREAEQIRINIEADHIKGKIALEQTTLEAENQRLQLETSKAKPEVSIGEAIRQRRAEVSMTQQELSRHTRIPVRRISMIENGEQSSIADIAAIAYAVDLVLLPPKIARPDRPADPPHRRRALEQANRERLEKERLENMAEAERHPAVELLEDYATTAPPEPRVEHNIRPVAGNRPKRYPPGTWDR